MNPLHAYAYGALVKMADRQVDPADFVRSAVRNNDSGALKIAEAILEYEKVAGGRVEAAGDLASAAAKRVARAPGDAVAGIGSGMAGAAGRAGDFAGNLAGGRQGRGIAQDTIDAFGELENLSEGQLEGLLASKRLMRDQNMALGAGGLAAAGGAAAGADYMATPEDSLANTLRGAVGMDQRTQGDATLEQLKELVGQ